MQRATPMCIASARMASRFFFTQGHRPNYRSHGQEPVGAAYKALGLKNNASLQEVKAAYRRLALKWCVIPLTFNSPLLLRVTINLACFIINECGTLKCNVTDVKSWANVVLHAL